MRAFLMTVAYKIILMMLGATDIATSNHTPTRMDRLRYDLFGLKIQRLWDSEISGLGVEVFPSGVRCGGFVIGYTKSSGSSI